MCLNLKLRPRKISNTTAIMEYSQVDQLVNLFLTIGLISMVLFSYRVAGPSGLFFGDAVALVALTGVFILQIHQRTFTQLLPSNTFLIIIGFLLAHSGIVMLFGPEYSFRIAIKEYLQFGFYCYFCWLASKKIRCPDRALVILALIVSVTVALQLLVYKISGERNLFHLPTLSYDLLWLSKYNKVYGHENNLMLTGLFQHPNQLALFSGAMYCYFLFKNKLFLSSAMAVCTVFSGSRTSLIIVAVFTLTYLAFNLKNGRRQQLLALGFLVLLISSTMFFGDVIIGKFKRVFSELGDPSAIARFQFLKIGINALFENVWIGTGFGNFQETIGIDNLENSWLLLAVELGLPTTAILIAIISFFIIKNPNRNKGSLALILSLGAMGVLHPFLLQSQIAPLFLFSLFYSQQMKQLDLTTEFNE